MEQGWDYRRKKSNRKGWLGRKKKKKDELCL